MDAIWLLLKMLQNMSPAVDNPQLIAVSTTTGPMYAIKLPISSDCVLVSDLKFSIESALSDIAVKLEAYQWDGTTPKDVSSKKTLKKLDKEPSYKQGSMEERDWRWKYDNRTSAADE